VRIFCRAIIALLLVGCAYDPSTEPDHVESGPSTEQAIVGTRTLAILLFCDSTVNPDTLASPGYYNDLIFSQGRPIIEAWSAGKATLAGQVFGWFVVADLASKSKTELSAIARPAGFDPAAFQVKGWVKTTATTGVAEVRNGTGNFTIGPYRQLGSFLHELLHVFGLRHGKKCLGTFPSCTSIKEYGDEYSIMGGGIFATNLSDMYPTAMHREMLGWITVRQINGAPGAKDISMSLYETTGDAIKVPRGDGDWFYIERRATGPHVCTLSPDDTTNRATLWLSDLPIVDPVSGIEIRSTPAGVSITWNAVLENLGFQPIASGGR